MSYTKNNIRNIPLTEFLAALGEKPVKTFKNMKLYYAPQREDPEPMLVVDIYTNRWFDHATNQSGDIIDLAALKMNPKLYTDPRDFILKYMNEYEHGKELSAMARQPLEPKVVTPDIRKIKLTDFMKALGQEHPIAADGDIRIYYAPYDIDKGPSMIINTRTNTWRDMKTGANGGIYDLAYEMTGSANIRELNMYIAGEMSNIQKVSIRQEPKEPPKNDDVIRAKRKMRL